MQTLQKRQLQTISHKGYIIVVVLCTTKWMIIVCTSYYCMSNYEVMWRTKI